MLGMIVGLVVTYVAAPISLFLGAWRLGDFDEDSAPLVLVCAGGAGPFAIALMLWSLFLIAPGFSDRFYFLVIFSIVTVLFLYGVWPYLSHRRDFFPTARGKKIVSWSKPTDWFIPVLTLILIAMVVTVVYQTLSTPLFMNDPLEYLQVSKHIYDLKSMNAYPIDEPLATGLYVNVNHPPGFNMLLVWSIIIGGDATSTALRGINIFYFLATIALLWVAMKDRPVLARLFAVLMLLSGPLYLSLVIGMHTDPQRIFLFYSAFCMLSLALIKPTMHMVVLSGVFVGFSLFSHSIGLLTLPFAGGIWLLLSRQSFSSKICSIAVLSFVALCLGGGQYFINLWLVGTPLADYEPILDLALFNYQYSLGVQRGLETLLEKILFGVLRCFTDFSLYGPAFWLGAGGALSVLWTKGNLFDWTTDELDATHLLVVAGYMALATMTALVGVLLVIKNGRYILTILPFVAFLGGIFLETAYARLRR